MHTPNFESTCYCEKNVKFSLCTILLQKWFSLNDTFWHDLQKVNPLNISLIFYDFKKWDFKRRSFGVENGKFDCENRQNRCFLSFFDRPKMAKTDKSRADDLCIFFDFFENWKNPLFCEFEIHQKARLDTQSTKRPLLGHHCDTVFSTLLFVTPIFANEFNVLKVVALCAQEYKHDFHCFFTCFFTCVKNRTFSSNLAFRRFWEISFFSISVFSNSQNHSFRTSGPPELAWKTWKTDIFQQSQSPKWPGDRLEKHEKHEKHRNEWLFCLFSEAPDSLAFSRGPKVAKTRSKREIFTEKSWKYKYSIRHPFLIVERPFLTIFTLQRPLQNALFFHSFFTSNFTVIFWPLRLSLRQNPSPKHDQKRPQKWPKNTSKKHHFLPLFGQNWDKNMCRGHGIFNVLLLTLRLPEACFSLFSLFFPFQNQPKTWSKSERPKFVIFVFFSHLVSEREKVCTCFFSYFFGRRLLQTWQL